MSANKIIFKKYKNRKYYNNTTRTYCSYMDIIEAIREDKEIEFYKWPHQDTATSLKDLMIFYLSHLLKDELSDMDEKELRQMISSLPLRIPKQSEKSSYNAKRGNEMTRLFEENLKRIREKALIQQLKEKRKNEPKRYPKMRGL